MECKLVLFKMQFSKALWEIFLCKCLAHLLNIIQGQSGQMKNIGTWRRQRSKNWQLSCKECQSSRWLAGWWLYRSERNVASFAQGYKGKKRSTVWSLVSAEKSTWWRQKTAPWQGSNIFLLPAEKGSLPQPVSLWGLNNIRLAHTLYKYHIHLQAANFSYLHLNAFS